MIFRVHHMTAPGVPHIYCRVFSAARPGLTFAALGNLTMRRDEFESFRAAFKAEFIDATPAPDERPLTSAKRGE